MSENKFVGSFKTVEDLVKHLRSTYGSGRVVVRLTDLPRKLEYPPESLEGKIKAVEELIQTARDVHSGELAGIRDAQKEAEADKPAAFAPPESFGGASGGTANASKNFDPLKNYDHGIHVPASTIPQVPENKRVKPATTAPDIKAVQYLEAAAMHMRYRAATYDNPQGEHSMVQTVKAFNAITGRNLTEAEGWEFMLLLKQVRVFTNPAVPHKDSLEDAVAYAALLADCMLSGKE